MDLIIYVVLLVTTGIQQLQAIGGVNQNPRILSHKHVIDGQNFDVYCGLNIFQLTTEVQEIFSVSVIRYTESSNGPEIILFFEVSYNKSVNIQKGRMDGSWIFLITSPPQFGAAISITNASLSDVGMYSCRMELQVNHLRVVYDFRELLEFANEMSYLRVNHNTAEILAAILSVIVIGGLTITVYTNKKKLASIFIKCNRTRAPIDGQLMMPQQDYFEQPQQDSMIHLQQESILHLEQESIVQPRQEYIKHPQTDSNLHSSQEFIVQPQQEYIIHPQTDSNLHSNLESTVQPQQENIIHPQTDSNLNSNLESTVQPQQEYIIIHPQTDSNLHSNLESTVQPQQENIIHPQTDSNLNSNLESTVQPQQEYIIIHPQTDSNLHSNLESTVQPQQEYIIHPQTDSNLNSNLESTVQPQQEIIEKVPHNGHSDSTESAVQKFYFHS